MKLPKSILTAALTLSVLATLLSVIACQRERQQPNSEQTQNASVYDSVMKAGKIRVAFVSYPPGCIVDPNTKEVSGIFPEVLRRIGENLGLKVEYTEEVGWGTMIEGLESGRYDIIGSPVWSNPKRGKLALLSKPIYYSGIGVWVRPDESRFSPENNWTSINSPDVRIAAMDGSTPLEIARTMFPNAKVVSYPDMTGEPQLFLDVTANKADVFFAEPSLGINFLKNNPGKVRNIAADHPIKVFPTSFMMKKREFQLKAMIDTALEDLENSGFVDQVIKKYEPGPNAIYRVATPYRTN